MDYDLHYPLINTCYLNCCGGGDEYYIQTRGIRTQDQSLISLLFQVMKGGIRRREEEVNYDSVLLRSTKTLIKTLLLQM